MRGNISLAQPGVGFPTAVEVPPVGPTPGEPVAQDEADETLAHMGRELMQQVSADALLIVWHALKVPVRLFSEGSWGGSAMERRIIDAASTVPTSDHAIEMEWHQIEGFDGEILTTRLPAACGGITLTARFGPVGGANRMRIRTSVQRLLPLVQPFFRIWALRQRSKRIATSLAATIDHSDVATLLVDGRGELLFVNESAERLLTRGEGLRRSGSHLAGERLSDTLRLQAAIDHALRDSKSGTAAPVVALKRDGQRALLAAVAAFETQSCGVHEVEAAIFIYDPDRDFADVAEPVCKHYGLSPVETKLARLLVDGASLTEAAERMRVREQTARTYLKQIFLKTDTNRQAEFVLLMLKSSVRLLSRAQPSFF